jgi:hypothetical protein
VRHWRWGLFRLINDRNGYDSALARDLLAILRKTLQMHEDHRERTIRELELGPPQLAATAETTSLLDGRRLECPPHRVAAGSALNGIAGACTTSSRSRAHARALLINRDCSALLTAAKRADWNHCEFLSVSMRDFENNESKKLSCVRPGSSCQNLQAEKLDQVGIPRRYSAASSRETNER